LFDTNDFMNGLAFMVDVNDMKCYKCGMDFSEMKFGDVVEHLKKERATIEC
jgi:hypothetical protein